MTNLNIFQTRPAFPLDVCLFICFLYYVHIRHKVETLTYSYISQKVIELLPPVPPPRRCFTHQKAGHRDLACRLLPFCSVPFHTKWFNTVLPSLSFHQMFSVLVFVSDRFQCHFFIIFHLSSISHSFKREIKLFLQSITTYIILWAMKPDSGSGTLCFSWREYFTFKHAYTDGAIGNGSGAWIGLDLRHYRQCGGSDCGTWFLTKHYSTVAKVYGGRALADPSLGRRLWWCPARLHKDTKPRPDAS